MQTFNKYFPWAAVVFLLLLLWFNWDSKDKGDKVTVTIPEKSGTMPPIYNPVPLLPPQKDYTYIYPQSSGNEPKIVKVENPLNEMLLKYFMNAEGKTKDSLYADAIGERVYDIVREDSLLVTKNKIKARGEVLSFEQEYTINPRSVNVPQKEVVFRMLGGVDFGNTTQLDRFSAKANLMFQNKKGNVISFSVDTQQNIWAGCNFNIWTIKKTPK